MTAILSAMAILRAMKPWHIMLAAIGFWTGFVGMKAYMAGKSAVIEQSKVEGKKNEEQAARAHQRARAPGSAERLRKTDCRDC